MRIAVVGAGVSGLVAANLLSRQHQVSVFEASDRAGGHTDTHQVESAGKLYSVDTGFIVFNRSNYPLFSQVLNRLKIASQATEMSFSAYHPSGRFEYKAHTLNSLFSQRRNLLRPSMYRMIADIIRFYREAPALLNSTDDGLQTGAYLASNNYSDSFIHHHLLPMASALWSAPPSQILQFPIRYMVQFFANHQMLQLRDRPQWRVIKGGSSQYIKPLCQPFSERLYLGTPVASINRSDSGVEVTTRAGERARFDRVVLACHSDQALALLSDPSTAEDEVLGSLSYQENQITLHTDIRMLPSRRRAWAAWNAQLTDLADGPCTVTYNMTILQSIDATEQFCVSLNASRHDDLIDPAKVIKRLRYHHPVYTHAAVKAQQRRDQINGSNNTYYCGAYWGFGFHEDGVRSAVDVANLFGINF